jgi:twitching motility protein PilI
MAKKISLREFQENLTARLKNVAAAAPVASKLGVLAGRQRWLVDLADVSESIPLPPLAHVSLTQPWFIGVVNVRGNLFGTVDFSAFLGGDMTTLNMEARLLFAHAKFQVNSGLVVSQVFGLRNLEQFQPRRKESEISWVSAEYVDTDGNVWKELDMRELLSYPDFFQVGA